MNQDKTQINTDRLQMNTDTKLLYPELSYEIRGAIYAVSNDYGKGLKEKVYQKALAEEFENRNIFFEREKRISIRSIKTGKEIGVYIPDFVVDDKIIIEIKASEFIARSNIEQQLSYLKSSKHEIGYLVNFSTPRLYIKRTIYTNDRKSSFIRGLLSVLIGIAIASSVFIGGSVHADFNEQINYQGKLTDTSSLAVTDGDWRMYFRLYTSATSATTTNIWEEDRSTEAGDRVTITNGLFSVMLGSSTVLSNVDFNQTLYLGVEICGLGSGALNCDGEMSPRKIIGAVPAAFEAGKSVS